MLKSVHFIGFVKFNCELFLNGKRVKLIFISAPGYLHMYFICTNYYYKVFSNSNFRLITARIIIFLDLEKALTIFTVYMSKDSFSTIIKAPSNKS